MLSQQRLLTYTPHGLPAYRRQQKESAALWEGGFPFVLGPSPPCLQQASPQVPEMLLPGGTPLLP